jgi:hypothetical protein
MPIPADTTQGRLTTAEAVHAYVLGDADRPCQNWTRKSLTLRSATTGARFTYRVKRPPGQGPERPWLISILTGPDNTQDYVYLGLLRPQRGSVILQHTAKSGLPRTAPAWLAWEYLTRAVLQGGRMPAALEVFHEGRCGRCGRTLTTPESVALGLGPECAAKVGQR